MAQVVQPSELAAARRRPFRRTVGLVATVTGRLVVLAVLIVAAAIYLFPLLWMFSTSLKDLGEVFAVPPIWIPANLLWINYPMSLNYFPFPLYLRNTLTIAVPAVLGVLVSSSLVAYGFSRVRWPGRDAVFLLLLGTMLIPSWTTLIPVYLIFARLHWTGTFLPLIVPSLFGSPFYIFLLRQFFLRQPQELVDAARIDGASHLGIYWSIILPLAKPALAVVLLFSFMDNWTDFFGPLIYLSREEMYTLSIGLYSFRGRNLTDWNMLMAASLMVASPMIILFFLTQRTFIEGITFTGIRA